MKTAEIWSRGNQENISYCLANDLPSLVWAANLASLELHTSLARCQKPDRPTMLVFDLDPGPGTDVTDCAEVGLRLREFLDEHGLECFPKTSGSKGLQIYAPLNTPATFEQTKEFAHHTARQLTHSHPDKVTSVMAKELRKGKVFIDWSQNDQHKTTVCAYSLRAKEQPTVSTPVRWSEVETAAKTRVAAKLTFRAEEVVKRAKKYGDLFAPVLRDKQKLPKLVELAAG
jgi:bifunctional non-homologous end joining protein LigD